MEWWIESDSRDLFTNPPTGHNDKIRREIMNWVPTMNFVLQLNGVHYWYRNFVAEAD